MVLGGVLAYTAIDMKKALAYSTLMALGVLTFLLGIGTQAAMVAFISFLLAHSLYKASFFMLAGAIDHSAGTKDLTQLGGLRKTMPITFGLMVVAALSLAGLPPAFGFVAKELLFEAALGIDISLVLVALTMASFGVGVAMVLALKPFLGSDNLLPKVPGPQARIGLHYKVHAGVAVSRPLLPARITQYRVHGNPGLGRERAHRREHAAPVHRGHAHVEARLEVGVQLPGFLERERGRGAFRPEPREADNVVHHGVGSGVPPGSWPGVNALGYGQE